MSGLPQYILPLIFVAIVPLALWRTVVAQKRAAENLRSIAADLGLNFQPPATWFKTARVSGERRGKLVEVFTYATGSGKSRRNWAALTVRPNTSGRLTFTLRSQGFNTKVMELFGVHEITVGDPDFDAAWFVQTNQPEFFAAALIPELRAKLLSAHRNFDRGKFELKDGAVKYFEPGSFANPQQAARIVAVADVVGDLADVAEVAATEGRA